MNLYEMTGTARQLLEMLETGDIDEETVQDTLDSIGVNEKLESYVYVINEMKADIDKIEAEEKRLKNKRKVMENGLGRVEEAVKKFILATDKDKVEAGNYTVGIRKSTKCVIYDDSLVPDRFKIQQPPKASTSMIKEALKAGEEVAGAELKEEQNLSIR